MKAHKNIKKAHDNTAGNNRSIIIFNEKELKSLKKLKKSTVKAHTEQQKKRDKDNDKDKVGQLKYEVGQEFGINRNTNTKKP